MREGDEARSARWRHGENEDAAVGNEERLVGLLGVLLMDLQRIRHSEDRKSATALEEGSTIPQQRTG